MLHRFVMIILMAGMVLNVLGDNLTDQQKKLKKVQDQLQAAEKKKKDAEKKKKQTDTEIQRTASLKRLTDQKVSELARIRSVRSDSLRSVRERLSDVESEVNFHTSLTGYEMDMLIRVDRSYKAENISHRDQRYLRMLMEQSSDKIRGLSGYRATLAQMEALRGQEFSEVSSKVKAESSLQNQQAKKIQDLQRQSSKLTQEQKNLQNQIAKLKKDAASLEGLIQKLTSSSTSSSTASSSTPGKIAPVPKATGTFRGSWPVRGKVIRGYGQETRAYNTSVTSNGIDIAVAEGTAVLAVNDGEVAFAGRFEGQGNLVIIDHQNGYFSVYAYNSSISVSKGSKVKRGQTIARSGSTGSASEPSLHFELRRDGKPVNPLSYLE